VKFLARHDTLIAIIGTAVLTAGYYWGIASPGRAAARTIENEITQAQTRISEFPNILAERSLLQSKLEVNREQAIQMETELPADSDVSDVLHQVASLARQSGLTINRLEPLPGVEFSSYTAHPFHLVCRGEFKDVVRFLSGLEQQPRLVSFSNVDFTRGNDRQPDGDAANAVQTNITFNVYSKHSKSTKPAENTMSFRSPSSDN
jgi:Tfp pilus assembly protein PilO